VLTLLEKGVHPTVIADCFAKAEKKTTRVQLSCC
jgi:chaperonin GroEL (HSP60 family)